MSRPERELPLEAAAAPLSPQGPAADTRERLIEAAASCYQRFGPGKTTVEDVAQAAGSSRATVYRHFQNRDELLLAVIARQAGALAAEAETHLREFDDVGSWLVEGMLFCLAEIPRRPLLAMLFAPEELGVASRLVLSSEQLLQIGTDILRPMFEPARRQGLLRAGIRIEWLIEWVLRLLMSYLAVPSRTLAGEDDLRRMLRTLLLPAVLAAPNPEPPREGATDG
jgi:AcrR family transcriptional regulator